jgi:hypothetical protein
MTVKKGRGTGDDFIYMDGKETHGAGGMSQVGG